jgi:hypothetical protein
MGSVVEGAIALAHDGRPWVEVGAGRSRWESPALKRVKHRRR